MSWVSAGCTLHVLKQKGRIHTQINNRFVSIIHHRSELYCIDSPCHHAGGPLGDGQVTDIEGIPCVKCPWHNFIFALDTGERVLQELRVPDRLPEGTFIPPSQMQFPLREWPPESLGPAKRTGVRAQRVHPVRISESGEVEVLVDGWPGSYLSDKPAMDAKRGKICMTIGEYSSLDIMPSTTIKQIGRFVPQGWEELSPTAAAVTSSPATVDDRSPPTSRGPTPPPE